MYKKESFKPHGATSLPYSDARGSREGGDGGIRQRHGATAVAILHPALVTLRHMAAAAAAACPSQGRCARVYRILTQTNVSS